ncbi:MAG: cell division protein FtsZ, partial [bacterium]
MIELCVEEEKKQQFGACLKVLGVGGAGGNAVNSMIATAETDGVEFITANTDAQALERSSAINKIQLGARITKGLGAGSNPDVGRRAAEEDVETIVKQIENTDILFLTAGLGGGTGSGSLPVIASIAREMGILTIAIVTKPFDFEGKRRQSIANNSIEQLKKAVDTLIVVPNQRLLEIVDAKISMLNAFALSNDILNQAIKGISDIITKPGHINVDFADVRTIMKDMGMAIMGTGRASGPDRAKKAALAAITSPLLENVSIEGAKGVLINITGNTDLGLYEINEAASAVYDLVSEDANIILGSVIDTSLENDIIVTVIATGFQQKEREKVIEKTNIQAATYEYNYEKKPADYTAYTQDRHIEQPAPKNYVSNSPSFTHIQSAQPIIMQPIIAQQAQVIEQPVQTTSIQAAPVIAQPAPVIIEQPVIAQPAQIIEQPVTVQAAPVQTASVQAAPVIIEEPIIAQPAQVIEQAATVQAAPIEIAQAPVQEAAPIQVQTTPAQPVQEAAPVQEAQPVQEAAPVIEHAVIEKSISEKVVANYVARQQERAASEQRQKHRENALALKDEQTDTDSDLDLNDFDTPTFLRKKQELQKKFNMQANKKDEDEYAQEMYDREIKKQQEKQRNSQLQ